MEVIKSNDEISEVFSSGKRLSNAYVTFMVASSDSLSRKNNDKCEEHGPCGRVAFIAGKKHGNAVWRNSAKRRMREIYRALDGSWKQSQVLFIAKPHILDASYSKVLESCKKTLDKISI